MVVSTPLKNMSSSVGIMTFPMYGKIKHVPNHQSVMYLVQWMIHFLVQFMKQNFVNGNSQDGWPWMILNGNIPELVLKNSTDGISGIDRLVKLLQFPNFLPTNLVESLPNPRTRGEILIWLTKLMTPVYGLYPIYASCFQTVGVIIVFLWQVSCWWWIFPNPATGLSENMVPMYHPI